MKKIIKIGIILCIIGVISLISLYIIAANTNVVPIKNSSSIYLYDKDMQVFFQGNGTNDWIELDKISPYLVNATLAVEDKNFYTHNGFDFLRLSKAIYNNVITLSKKEGASTITQQLARNLYLTMDKTWERKLNEAWLTIKIETQYSKDDIIEAYLNTINYNHGAYGIENAAKYYFNKSATDLTLAEASLLAGIPKAPSHYSPLVDYDKAKERQNIILGLMVKNGYITEDEKKEAAKEEFTFYGKLDKQNSATLKYYEDAVLDELYSLDSIPKSMIETGGIRVYTKLDLDKQKELETSVNENLLNGELQTAAVLMEPNTGAVVSLIGGVDYATSEYNRAVDSKRQVGSTMKPFLYYVALENGFTASTTFLSEETVFTFSGDKTYTPSNFNNKYPNKAISLVAALAYSDNIYAVKTHLFLGEDVLVDMAKRVGINETLTPNPSLALGSNEINITDLVSGYATFANEGYKVDPYFIERVEDKNGNILYEHRENKSSVLNKNLVFILNDMLNSTYDYHMVEYATPTAITLSSMLEHKYAIKTGSTDYDSWIVGYNKDFVLGVWVGYDDSSVLTSTDTSYSKNIWADFVSTSYNYNAWYEKPNNVSAVLINPITGNAAVEADTNKRILYYVKGTEPTYSTNDLEAVFKETQ